MKDGGGGGAIFEESQVIRLYAYGPLGAKKKQGSGRSPEILTPNGHAQWISAITYDALELQSSKCLSEALIPRGMWPPGARTPKVEAGASLLKNPKAIHLYVY